MKKMKAEQKRKLAGVLAIVLIVTLVLSAVLPVFLTAVRADEGSDYTIEANLGFDGVGKYGYSFPLSVDLQNNSQKNFFGTVSVLMIDQYNTYNSDNSYVRYSQAVEMPKGGSGRAEFSVPLLYQKKIKIQLTEKNKVICEKDFDFTIKSNEECWIGLLSDDADSLHHINPPYYSGTRGQAVDLGKILKENKTFIDFSAINIFLVNDFDLATLSDEALGEIINRINQGATMLVGGKSHIGSLDRLSMGNLTTVDKVYSNIPDGTTIDADVTESTNIDNEYSAGYTKTDNCTIYEMGDGYIFYTGFNFADTFDSNTDSQVSDILNVVCQHTESSMGAYEFESDLIGYTDRMPNLTDHTIGIIKLIIVLYIIFIPVLYIILKNKDKRENALKIIPSAAIVVSLLIYAVSLTTSYKKPIASVINYINFANGGGNAVEKTFMNVKSPLKGDLEIVTEKGKTCKKVSDNSYFNTMEFSYTPSVSNENDEDKTVNTEVLNKDGATVIKLNDKPMWDNTYITLQGAYKGEGSFESDLSVDENLILHGKIKNNTGVDFSTAVVIVSRGGEIIACRDAGEIKNGEEFDISAMDVNVMDSALDSSSYYNIMGTISPEDRRANLQKSYEHEIENDIADGIFSDIERSVNTNQTSIDVTAVGFSHEPLYGGETTVNSKKVIANETNVYRGCFTLGFDNLIKNRVVGLEGLIQTHTNADDRLWYIPVGNSAHVENNLIYITNGDVLELKCINSERKPFSINWEALEDSLEIYNNYTGQWEELYPYIYNFQTSDDYMAYIDNYGEMAIRALNVEQIYVVGPTITLYDDEN